MCGVAIRNPPMSKRFVPDRRFPPYAYLPGRHPHPVRDTDGHSFGVQAHDDTQEVYWGVDLFNAGFYWEAHEAWEPLWRAAPRTSAEHILFKALILLAAAGLKRRESKIGPACRHASRAMDTLQALDGQHGEGSFPFEAGRLLAGWIKDVPWQTHESFALDAVPVPVFDFSISFIASGYARKNMKPASDS